jgi:hypothetical protein
MGELQSRGSLRLRELRQPPRELRSQLPSYWKFRGGRAGVGGGLRSSYLLL